MVQHLATLLWASRGVCKKVPDVDNNKTTKINSNYLYGIILQLCVGCCVFCEREDSIIAQASLIPKWDVKFSSAHVTFLELRATICFLAHTFNEPTKLRPSSELQPLSSHTKSVSNTA